MMGMSSHKLAGLGRAATVFSDLKTDTNTFGQTWRIEAGAQEFWCPVRKRDLGDLLAKRIYDVETARNSYERPGRRVFR